MSIPTETEQSLKSKPAYFSNLPANFWLAASITLVVISLLTIYIVVLRSHTIEIEHKTDGIAVLLGVLTLAAGAVTVWISWLIKEEAREISLNIITENRESIYFGMRLPLLQSITKTGYTWAAAVAAQKLASPETPSPAFSFSKHVAEQASRALWEMQPKAGGNQSTSPEFLEAKKLRDEVLLLILVFLQWPDFKRFSETAASLATERGEMVMKKIGSFLSIDEYKKLRNWLQELSVLDYDGIARLFKNDEKSHVANFKNLLMLVGSDSPDIQLFLFALTVYLDRVTVIS